MKKLSICIIIPAYNEDSVIYDVVKKVKNSFSKSPYSGIILLVNDGSSDNTSAEARKAGAIVVDHILNSGAGGATSTGLRYAKKHGYDVAATMDADGQHAPEDVIRGITFLIDSGADLVVGSRLIDSTGMSKVKTLGNWGLSFITMLLFGIKSTDSQSGLRIFSKNAIDVLYWKTSSYEFCSEMLWRAKQLHLTYAEYPIKAIYTDYSKGKGQNNWNALNIVKRLLKRRVVEILQ